MRRFLSIIIALALLTSTAALRAAPSAPADLRAAWSSDTRLTATLSRTQTSDAAQVCVEKRDAANVYTLIGCGPGQANESFVVVLPPVAPHDEALVPHVGDRYSLVETFTSGEEASYDAVTLGPRTVLLPLVARP